MSINELLNGSSSMKNWCNLQVNNITAQGITGATGNFNEIFVDDLVVSTVTVENLEANDLNVSNELTANEISFNGLTGATGTITSFVTDSIVFPTAGATALSNYTESTFGVTLSGIWASSHEQTIKATRNGKLVNLMLGAVSANSNTPATITSTAIPTTFRPGTLFKAPIFVIDDGTAKAGSVNVDTNGVLTVFVSASSNFAGASGSGVSGIVSNSVSYNLL